MEITLDQILSLVGKLDDSPGDETPRERFRRFLKENVVEVGRVRDYVEECLRQSGDKYTRALQDLVNYCGYFLGFEVNFGRYQGVPGQIGFDGQWKSPADFHIVVEVKTTEVYAIKTSTLVGYIDQLISAKAIPDWDNAIGLYVVGRPDPEIRQLENAIIAEKRTHQLRIIAVESLLSLAEMKNEYDVSHEDVLAVIRPSRPTIDSVVGLMARLVAQRGAEMATTKEAPAPAKTLIWPLSTAGAEAPTAEEAGFPQPSLLDEAAYWLTPVKSFEEQTAEENIRTLVGKERVYAFGDRTPGRKHLKPEDWICFYETGKGVVAHAMVASAPEKTQHKAVRRPEQYPWVFGLSGTEVYLEKPVILDAALRVQLDAFRSRDPNKSWSWFVQSTRKIAKHDFELLTRQ